MCAVMPNETLNSPCLVSQQEPLCPDQLVGIPYLVTSVSIKVFSMEMGLVGEGEEVVRL